MNEKLEEWAKRIDDQLHFVDIERRHDMAGSPRPMFGGNQAQWTWSGTQRWVTCQISRAFPNEAVDVWFWVEPNWHNEPDAILSMDPAAHEENAKRIYDFLSGKG